MTRYIGIRFENRYRSPGCEPFRYDHPTVDVDTDRIDELERAGEALGVSLDDLRARFDPDERERRYPDRDPNRIEAEEIEWLREGCARLRDACVAYDLDAIRDAVGTAAAIDDRNAVVVADDVRETVGPDRYDALLAYERTRDLVALCDVALEEGVSLETT